MLRSGTAASRYDSERREHSTDDDLLEVGKLQYILEGAKGFSADRKNCFSKR